jgi:hypothetical protein
MKYRRLKLIIALMVILTTACNEPETVITDIVHTDGSVTRKIEMKNQENNFKISDIQVPFDSTWAIRDSLEFNDKGDTIWVKRAEKVFKSVDGINQDYKSDSSANREVVRSASFSKKFRWFHTNYRFSETIDREMSHGYPVSDFLNSQELTWFYSPDNTNDKKRNGPDSLIYKAIDDSVKKKTDIWTTRSIISEWIAEFSDLTRTGTGHGIVADSLKAHEGYFADLVMENEDKFDSLWTNGELLRDFIGESNAKKYKEEADSALNLITKKILVTFSNYTLRISMPGRVTGSDGFIDSAGTLLWPVKSDYFLTTPYVMWAESKVPNTWAWIISGIFVGFVLTGIFVGRK